MVKQFSDEIESYIELFRAKAAPQDFDDLNHAIAGREVGRHRKHIQEGGIDPVTGEKRKTASERALETLQWLLINDPEYARIHTRAMTALTGAESSAADALSQITDAVAEGREMLAAMEGRAARLEDGTLVFRKANGDVVDAEGKRIADDLAAQIDWRGDEPTYEEYQAQRERIETLERSERELRGIETELGDIRGELTDEDSPASKDRMETLTERIGEIEREIEARRPAANDFKRAFDNEVPTNDDTLSMQVERPKL